MSKTQRVYPKVAPLVTFDVVKIEGNISRVTINGGGGMGGSSITLYGILDEKLDKLGLCVLRLPVSAREIRVNPRYIGTAEPVALWRATTVHNNDNFESPIIEHFSTHHKTVVVHSEVPSPWRNDGRDLIPENRC